jgi:hypothetical protein
MSDEKREELQGRGKMMSDEAREEFYRFAQMLSWWEKICAYTILFFFPRTSATVAEIIFILDSELEPFDPFGDKNEKKK